MVGRWPEFVAAYHKDYWVRQEVFFMFTRSVRTSVFEPKAAKTEVWFTPLPRC